MSETRIKISVRKWHKKCGREIFPCGFEEIFKMQQLGLLKRAPPVSPSSSLTFEADKSMKVTKVW